MGRAEVGVDGETGFPSSPAKGGVDRTYGRRRTFWRWDALVGPHPLPRSSFAGAPALSLSKRGDQSRARGRSNAVQAALARMFCPPLKERPEEGRHNLRTGRVWVGRALRAWLRIS